MYVFVYGTLRIGHGNHARLLGREPYATIIAELPYRMVSLGGFPGLVPCGMGTDGPKTTQITGELYDVTEKEFRALDMLEGYPHFYNRIQFPLQQYGIDDEAWVYVLRSEDGIGCLDVESGDWVEFRKQINATR